MGTLHHHPFLIRYQGGAGDHVVQIRAGRTIRSGVGQSFWLRAGRCALAEVPTANRTHSFLVQVPSADQQNVSAQVAITYRIEDAEAAASHYDFDLYPRDASNDAQGLWQIDETVTRIATRPWPRPLARCPCPRPSPALWIASARSSKRPSNRTSGCAPPASPSSTRAS